MEDFFLNTAGTWIIGMVQGNPAFAGILIFVGFARVTIKPAMTILHAYVKITPYDSDDKWLSSVEQSKGYKLVVYLLDWLLSVKTAKKQD
jgi:hypothetical protein